MVNWYLSNRKHGSRRHLQRYLPHASYLYKKLMKEFFLPLLTVVAGIVQTGTDQKSMRNSPNSTQNIVHVLTSCFTAIVQYRKPFFST